MWYIDTMEYYSAPQNNETTSFAATWMALESFILRQKEKYKYHIASIYTWNLKHDTDYETDSET